MHMHSGTTRAQSQTVTVAAEMEGDAAKGRDVSELVRPKGVIPYCQSRRMISFEPTSSLSVYPFC
jgi:hypothetical protein